MDVYRCLWDTHVYDYYYIYIYIDRSIDRSIYPSIYVSIYLSIYLSVYQSINLSISIYFYLSISIYVIIYLIRIDIKTLMFTDVIRVLFVFYPRPISCCKSMTRVAMDPFRSPSAGAGKKLGHRRSTSV